MSSGPIRVLIADDHALVREGIRRVLEDDGGFEIVAEATDGHEARRSLLEDEPDVALLDIAMPGPSGIALVEELQARGSPVRTLILSMYDDPEYVRLALEAGAGGFLLKDEAGPSELRRAVRAVHAGRSVYSGRVTRRLAAALGSERKRHAILAELTAREREVLERVAAGETSKQIAGALGISPRTVETHRKNLMRKLDVHSATGLTRIAIEQGLLAPTKPSGEPS